MGHSYIHSPFLILAHDDCPWIIISVAIMSVSTNTDSLHTAFNTITVSYAPVPVP